jgi:hypothetical protein
LRTKAIAASLLIHSAGQSRGVIASGASLPASDAPHTSGSLVPPKVRNPRLQGACCRPAAPIPLVQPMSLVSRPIEACGTALTTTRIFQIARLRSNCAARAPFCLRRRGDAGSVAKEVVFLPCRCAALPMLGRAEGLKATTRYRHDVLNDGSLLVLAPLPERIDVPALRCSSDKCKGFQRRGQITRCDCSPSLQRQCSS